ncbi:hypothetical protein PS2_006034 [Malus domestica]
MNLSCLSANLFSFCTWMNYLISGSWVLCEYIQGKVEVGESSGAKPCEELWAKLLPSGSRYPDVEISSCEIVVCSKILFSSIRKCKWCKVTRNSDHSSATIQNKSSDAIVVDGTVIQSEDTIVIRCGSEITSGPDKKGYLSYRFNVLPGPGSCQKKLKISMDAEHAICCICLNIWHDVVTVAPCFHNFCNECFPKWLKRSLEKRSSVLRPHCRAVVQFVGRNHFLLNVVDEILKADSSLKRTNDEVAILDSYATMQSNLVVKRARSQVMKKLIIHQIHALNVVLNMVGSAAIKPLSICNVKHAEE